MIPIRTSLQGTAWGIGHGARVNPAARAAIQGQARALPNEAATVTRAGRERRAAPDDPSEPPRLMALAWMPLRRTVLGTYE